MYHNAFQKIVLLFQHFSQKVLKNSYTYRPQWLVEVNQS